jgi:hypothetical protein
MMKLQNIFFATVLILLWGCQNDRTVSENTKGKLVFKTETSENNPDFKVQDIVAIADSTGHIFIRLTVQNTSGNKIESNSYDWELNTADGLRSTPLRNDSVILILPGTTTIALEFEPTNSLTLYRLTSMKGDLGKNYQLTYKQGQIQAALSLSDEQHAAYKKKWAIEKDVTIFQLNQPASFTGEEETYLTKKIMLQHDNERMYHNVHVSEEEILVDGLNTKLSAYHLKDTLYVNVTLINHSPFVVTVDLSSFNIHSDTLSWKPFLDGGDSYFEIPKSQRKFITAKYFLPALSSKEFTLNVSSLKFRIPESVTVFCQPNVTFSKRE